MKGRAKPEAKAITRAEYDTLLARLDDVEDALRMRAAEARGTTSDAMPSELVKRMLAGEHPVRIWREHRGLTRAELAARAEIPPGYLSEIENGKKPGSVSAYNKVASALDVNVDDILPEEPTFIRQDGIYNPAKETVRFYALHGRENVGFAIARDVLERRFRLKERSEAEILQVFEKNRDQIEAIAARLYEQGARRRDGFIVIDVRAIDELDS